MIEKHAFIPITLYTQHSHIRPYAITVGTSKVITYAESEKGVMRGLAESTGLQIKEDQSTEQVIAAIETGVDAIYVVYTEQAREIVAYFSESTSVG